MLSWRSIWLAVHICPRRAVLVSVVAVAVAHNAVRAVDTHWVTRAVRCVLAVALIATVAVGCGSRHPTAVDRAEFRYWINQNHALHAQAASCDRHGDPITIKGRTYSAYLCTIHGGSGDGITFAAYWDGRRPLSCPQLPRAAQNALCFD